MKTLMTTSLMTLLMTGTALMAQTGKAPATPPAAAAANAANPAPVKVKKHHRKGTKHTPSAENANPAKK